MADIQYLNYGDLQIELLALLNTLANLVQNYVAGQPWSTKRKEKFMSAYTDIINRGILGASSNAGIWLIQVGGTPLEFQSNKDKEMYEAAAYFIQQLMANLSKSSTIKKEEKSDLPVFSNELFLSDITKDINNDNFGGLSEGFKTSEWNEFDERDSTGKRGKTNRAQILASQLEKYRDSLSEEKYNFKDSSFGSLDEFKTRLNSAISALRNSDETDDKEALLRIGIRESDWFNNGLGDPSGKTIKLEDGTEWSPTYGDLIEYNQKLEKLKLEEKVATEKALAANRFLKMRRYNISKAADIPIKDYDALTLKLSTYQELNLDDLNGISWAIKNGVLLNDLTREEFVKMPSLYRKPHRLKSISGLLGIYYDSVDGNLVQLFNEGLVGGSSFLDILNKNNLENSEEYKILKADERVLSDDFKTEDYLRMGAIALDITGALAAFVPGYGTAASGLLGLTSLGTNFTADVMDDSLTKLDVAKNAGINTILGLVGILPGLGVGAKSTRWLTQIAKWVPRILTGAMATQVALSDDIKNSLRKAGDSSKWNTITNHDMKNIAYALSVVAGTARIGRGVYDNRKYKPAFKGGTEAKDFIITKSGKRIEAKPEQIEKINKAGRKGGTEKANEELRKLPGAEHEEVSNEFKTGWFPKGKVETAHETMPVESPHRVLAYARKLRMENEALKKRFPLISKVLPTSYDIYRGASQFLMPKIDIIERIKRAWNPIPEGKFKSTSTTNSSTTSSPTTSSSPAVTSTPTGSNAKPKPSSLTKAESLELLSTMRGKNFSTNTPMLELATSVKGFGDIYFLDAKNGNLTLTFELANGLKFEITSVVGNKNENLKLLQKAMKNIDSKLPKAQKSKIKLEVIRKLKSIGALKYGGKITDSQIDNFLKQYK